MSEEYAVAAMAKSTTLSDKVAANYKDYTTSLQVKIGPASQLNYIGPPSHLMAPLLSLCTVAAEYQHRVELYCRGEFPGHRRRAQNPGHSRAVGGA